MNSPDSQDRFAATNTIASRLRDLQGEMRAAIGQVSDPQGQAVLETGAEVIGGLRQAFVDYASGTEDAWQR